MPPAVAEAAFQAGNGIQLGLDVAWDVFLAIGTAMLAWNMREQPRFGRACAATGLLLAAALVGLNLAAFPENSGRAGSGPARVSAGPGVSGSWAGDAKQWQQSGGVAAQRGGNLAVAAGAQVRVW